MVWDLGLENRSYENYKRSVGKRTGQFKNRIKKDYRNLEMLVYAEIEYKTLYIYKDYICD